jgi:hypothetical protein
MPEAIDRRTRVAFLLLVVVQAAHSIEEVVFKLYAVYPPARFISSLFGERLGLWFAAANALIVAVGVWCYVAPVRAQHPSAVTWMWVWVVVEAINGTNHMVMAVVRGGYFPGVATAPALLAVSLYLGRRLAHRVPS